MNKFKSMSNHDIVVELNKYNDYKKAYLNHFFYEDSFGSLDDYLSKLFLSVLLFKKDYQEYKFLYHEASTRDFKHINETLYFMKTNALKMIEKQLEYFKFKGIIKGHTKVNYCAEIIYAQLKFKLIDESIEESVYNHEMDIICFCRMFTKLICE